MVHALEERTAEVTKAGMYQFLDKHGRGSLYMLVQVPMSKDSRDVVVPIPRRTREPMSMPLF
jgi:hypothetical protein